MDNGKSLINIGELAKPATVLIEKISDAIGGYFKPYQIRRVARAEADADISKALAQVEINELTRRALGRFIAEETKKQDNIESITFKALPQLEADSKPQEVDDDWITNFFDKCRLISDEEMQALWAKVLAGEANTPGEYSKRTVNFLGSLDKSDAALFATLCGFVWFIGGYVPLIYDINSSIYIDHGISFDVLKHLDDIGLLRLEGLTGYKRMGIPKRITFFYYSTPINIEFVKEENNVIEVGKVLFSKIGQELGPICGSKPIPDFLDYVINYWRKKGLIVSSPYPLTLQ
jgi:hypothetical protein